MANDCTVYIQIHFTKERKTILPIQIDKHLWSQSSTCHRLYLNVCWQIISFRKEVNMQ